MGRPSNNTDVTLSFSCFDVPSGVASCPGNLTFDTEGIHTGTVQSTDVAGNVSSLPYVVKIDKTPPEAKNVFNPDTLTVDVLGLDDGSGVVDITVDCVPTSWGGGSDKSSGKSSKKSGKGPDAELCTYTITDAAGNVTVLVEKRRTGGSGGSDKSGSSKKSGKGGGGGNIHIGVISVQYNGGDVIEFPPKADKKFEWSLNKDGSLKELEQKMELGKGKNRQQVTAHYNAKKNQTEFTIRGQKGRLVGDGLLLLCMQTDGGDLTIVVPDGLVPKGGGSDKSGKSSEKGSTKSSSKGSSKSSGKG